MVRRKTAVVNNRRTEVMIPDSEWLAEKYAEFSRRFFSFHRLPDADGGVMRVTMSGRLKKSWGITYFWSSKCGGAFRCRVEEAPTQRPEHIGRNIPGFVWIRGRSHGEPRMEIRLSGKTYLPEKAWEGVLIHEMVHAACYWNGLWTGNGHDGWFMDLAEEIGQASGGEFTIQRFVDRETMLDREDIEAESLVPGEDYGFAVAARLGYNGRQFDDLTTAGKDDPVLSIHGWRGINTAVWRCATLEEAKRGVTMLRNSYKEPFSVDGDMPIVHSEGKRYTFMPKVVGFSIYEFNRNNVEDRSRRKAVQREFAKLAPLPDSFPAPMQTKDEIYNGQAIVANGKFADAGIAVKLWDSDGGWTDAYRNRGRTGVSESFIGNAVDAIGRGMSRIGELLKSVFRSLWGEPEVRDYGDGHVDLAIP